MGLLPLPRDNQALDINPPAGDQELSEHGSDWLWAVTAIYVLSFLAFFVLSHFARAGERIFHYLFAVALLVGTITYFAEASDLGWSVVAQANHIDNGATRQIFFAKYVNWVVSFPVVIITLGLLSGVSWATIFYNVALSWVWIVSYLLSAFTATNYKWGFFAFGSVAWLVLALSTLREGSLAARRVGGFERDHHGLAGWVNLLWLLYPIAFAVSDGSNKIGVTPSFIFFGILDVLLVPLVAFAVLVLARHWDYGRLNIAFTQYGRVNAAPGTYPEKAAAPAPAAGTAAV